MDGSLQTGEAGQCQEAGHREGLSAGGAPCPLNLTLDLRHPSGLWGTSSGTLTSGPITALVLEALGKGALASDCLWGRILSSPALEPGKLRSERWGGFSPDPRGDAGTAAEKPWAEAPLPSFPENFVLMLWEIFVNSFSHVIF